MSSYSTKYTSRQPSWRLMLIWLAVSFLFFTSAPASADLSVDEILNKMVESYGGAEALAKLNAPYQQIWELTALTRNEKGIDHRVIDLPDKLTIELTYPSKSETRILQGNSGWKIYGKSKRIKAGGPGLDAMRLQRMRLYNPLLLRQRAAQIQVDHQVQGYFRLSLREKRIVSIYYVNKETLLIDKVTGTLNIGGMSMTFLTQYYDYKKVAGVMMAHREVKYAGDVNTAIVILRSTDFTTTAYI